MAASGGFGPPECQSQSLMPYHLATRQYKVVEGHGFEPWNPKEQIYSLPRLATSLSLQLVPTKRLELLTYRLQGDCSTN